MRITLLGAGAMGCLFGGLLAEQGNSVTLVDSCPERLKAVADQGLLLEEQGRERRIRGLLTAAPPHGAEDAELLVVFVKSSDTFGAVSSLRIPPNTVVLTLQNGLGNIEAIRRAGISRLAAGVTGNGASYFAPGAVRFAGRGETVIGWAAPDQEALSQAGQPESMPLSAPGLEDIRVAFERAGLPTRIVSDIKGPIWTKLLVNAGINAATALCLAPNGVMAEHPEAAALLRAVVEEGWQIARALGVSLDTADPVAHAVAIARATASNRSSMLQDILAGRSTEINVINGALAACAAELGMVAPVNETLARLVRIREEAGMVLPAQCGTL